MPLTDDQKTALETLKGADPKDVADAMRSTASDHYQAIYRVGFGTAKGEYENAEKTGKMDKVAADLELERTKSEAKDAELTKLREKTPDAEAIRQEYEAKLTAKEKEKQEAIEAAEKRVESVHGEKFDAEFAGQLIALGVEPDYAREVLVPKHRPRRKVERDGTVKFYDDDGSTPLAAVNGELPRVAAEKVKGTVDAKWIVSQSDKGGGSQGGSDKGGSNKFDAIRKQGQALSSESGTSKKVAERIGLA